jgi:putative transposase
MEQSPQIRIIAGIKQSRFTDEQIIGFLKQAKAGMSVKELCRSGCFSQPNFYK